MVLVGLLLTFVLQIFVFKKLKKNAGKLTELVVLPESESY